MAEALFFVVYLSDEEQLSSGRATVF